MSGAERFLLIKAWGAGFWSDLDDVQGKLMLAEITNRQPVVYWGRSSRYSVGDQVNSFEQYYQPVSQYSVTDLVKEEYTYDPPQWNPSNIYPDDGVKRGDRANKDIPSYLKSDARVLVTDIHSSMHYIIPWIPASHPVYGLPTDSVNRYIINKYLKLQPEIVTEIEEFYNANLKTGPILAVHVRFDLETACEWGHFYHVDIDAVNQRYFNEVDKYLQANPKARIFLMTANQRILERYLQKYGDILIYTDCRRSDHHSICGDRYPAPKRKGIEIIKDTYLACKCDHFIGCRYSNILVAVRRLKEWDVGAFEFIG
jgi:hypothetical protein